MVKLLINAMSSNPQFIQSTRQFNGDYNKDLLNEEIDAGTSIPAACMDDMKPTQRQAVCEECEACPICPVPEACNMSCPRYSDYVLNGTIIYGVIGVFLFLMLIALVIK